MKVAPLITVALILCIACPGLIQAKKKPKPKFCIGKNGNEYAVGNWYVDKEGDVCIRYKCVKKKKKVFIKEKKCIDGEWSDWSSWSACTATCGKATRTKERTCSNPPPSKGGNQCSGKDEKIEECSLTECGNDTIQALQAAVATLQAEMQSIQSTTNKHGTCMSDLSSSDCPDSAPGKVGVVDGISTNKAGVTSAKADINTNQAGISTNTAGVTSAKADINTNKAGISTNTAGVTSAKADINTNKAGIKTNKADINTNKAGISSNTAGVTSAKADINTNKGGISTNTAGVTSAKADINTNKGGINTNKANIDTSNAAINTNKAGIMENKAAIAAHHVPVSSKMTSAVVLSACIKKGMKPQCYGESYTDINCVQAPSNSPVNQHPMGISKILCGHNSPQDCASTLNMFWYMNNWGSGSACGATKAGSYCSKGKDYTSTIDMPYFAACLKPVTTDWTIIQRRGQYGNAEDYFYKDFKDYEDGFGSGGELWIGLKKLAALTKDGEWEWELQVDLTDWDDKKYHAKYATFSVGPAPTYTLHVGGFDDSNSTLGDSMTYHSGSAFSAPDKDQDSSNFFDCAVHYKGGWWYESCLKANINGLNFAQQKDVNGGMTWYFGGGRGNYWKTWKASVMKITRVKV